MSGRRYPATLEGQKVGPDAWRTVSYYSEPIGRAVGFVIIFSVPALLLLGLAAGIRWLVGLQAMWVLIIASVLGIAAFMYMLPIYFRHSQEGIDLARIDADREADLARIDAEREVQITQAETVQLQAHVQLRQIDVESERTLARPAQGVMNRAATFVPPVAPAGEEERGSHWAKPGFDIRQARAIEPLRQDVMVQVMLAWAAEIHDNINADGRIASTLPWGKRGALSNVDAERAQKWLQLASNAAGDWIVDYNKPKQGWYLNIKRFPTAAALLAAFAQVAPPRFTPGGG